MDNGKYALVTGASSGIGLAFSEELAKQGYPLVMVSNEQEKIALAAQMIQEKFRVRAIPVFMDLAQTNAAQKLFDYCAANKINIYILINNAGIFFFRDIIDTPVSRLETIINLHITTPTMLCRLFAEQMAACESSSKIRNGFILNVSSIAAWMMMPGLTMYNSTKSYLYCFSRAMRRELIDRGVSITVLCPGAAATGLYNLPSRYMKLGIRLGIIITSERLVRLALKKMFAEKAKFIPGGLINRIFIFIVEKMPEFLIRRIRKKLLMGTSKNFSF